MDQQNQTPTTQPDRAARAKAVRLANWLIAMTCGVVMSLLVLLLLGLLGIWPPEGETKIVERVVYVTVTDTAPPASSTTAESTTTTASTTKKKKKTTKKTTRKTTAATTATSVATDAEPGGCGCCCTCTCCSHNGGNCEGACAASTTAPAPSGADTTQPDGSGS